MEDLLELIFIYSRYDEKLLSPLQKQLSPLKSRGLISGWYDREIVAGTDWEFEIDMHLNLASIILLLVSSDFIASSYCSGRELKRALERHELGEARVIPIILRPVIWWYTPFGKLQALPKDAKPVTTWPNRDEAYFDIAIGIQKVLKEQKKN
jgi:hypothetical protein